jgi:hypothetical protein
LGRRAPGLDSEPLRQWAGQRSGPVAVYENERPRSGWAEILLLAERLTAKPSLLPTDPFDRALVFGLAHEICGEGGLGRSRRLQLVHAGLNGAGGFSERVSKYLGKKPRGGRRRRIPAPRFVIKTESVNPRFGEVFQQTAKADSVALDFSASGCPMFGHFDCARGWAASSAGMVRRILQ